MRGFSAAALHYYREPLANLTLLDPLIPSSYYLGAYYLCYSIIPSSIKSIIKVSHIPGSHKRYIKVCRECASAAEAHYILALHRGRLTPKDSGLHTPKGMYLVLLSMVNGVTGHVIVIKSLFLELLCIYNLEGLPTEFSDTIFYFQKISVRLFSVYLIISS